MFFKLKLKNFLYVFDFVFKINQKITEIIINAVIK